MITTLVNYRVSVFSSVTQVVSDSFFFFLWLETFKIFYYIWYKWQEIWIQSTQYWKWNVNDSYHALSLRYKDTLNWCNQESNINGLTWKCYDGVPTSREESGRIILFFFLTWKPQLGSYSFPPRSILNTLLFCCNTVENKGTGHIGQ